MDLVSQRHWDQAYQNFSYHVADDEVTRWIKKEFIQLDSKKSIFEFGCYPGRYLSFLGLSGWEVNGIDLTPGIAAPPFREWLQSLKVETGILRQADALLYAKTTSDRFDAVCSFGFIEHFNEFDRIIELHDKILKPGGWLVITTPNFRGSVQKFLHQNFNAKSLGIHYLPSMRPDLWKTQLVQKGYVIKQAGYFGGFDFWWDKEERNSFQKLMLKVLGNAKSVLKNLPDNGLYSPYCGIIAQKPNA